MEIEDISSARSLEETGARFYTFQYAFKIPLQHSRLTKTSYLDGAKCILLRTKVGQVPDLRSGNYHAVNRTVCGIVTTWQATLHA